MLKRILAYLTFFLLSFSIAFGQEGGEFKRLKLPWFTNVSDLWRVIAGVVNIILALAGLVAFFYIIYGGFLYLTAAGDPEKATKGKTTLIYAFLGIVIIVLAYVIVRYLIGILD